MHFLCFQDHPMVRDGRNKLRPGEHSRWRASYSHVSYKSGNHGDIAVYDTKELLVILFDHVANFLSVGSGWRFDSVQSLAISLCPFRSTIGAGSFIQTPKSLHKNGVLNIKNLEDDFCFVWCVLVHIHRVDKHAYQPYNYQKYFNELNISGLNFPLKYPDTSKFETFNPTISVNVVVFENNEVFSLYASKHRDRKHHVNLLMISNSEGKFHYLLVRLVRSRSWSHQPSTPCVSLSILSLLLLECATANSSPLRLFHPPRAEGRVPITGRSWEKYQKV